MAVAAMQYHWTPMLSTAGMLVSSTSGVDLDAPAATGLPEGSEDAARLDAVVKEKGHDKFGEWVSIETDGGPLYAWRATGELSSVATPLSWRAIGRPRAAHARAPRASPS